MMKNENQKSERGGILIAGNIVADRVKVIDAYPDKHMLSNISSVSTAVGGCVPNVAIDLKKIDKTLDVRAAGQVGDDDAGRYILGQLENHGIGTRLVKVVCDDSTSFSDVMTEAGTGERTFFHYRGANAGFSPKDLPADALDCRMLHIGYIMLLDAFDRADAEYGTVMARFLRDAQAAGVKTSVDAVSDISGRFAEKVLPALKYADNAIMNETEACGAAGVEPRKNDGSLDLTNSRAAAEKLMSCGVGERVMIHCPEAGFILNANGAFTAVPSLRLPDGFIKGSVGAGDAFCAGCLYGIYNGYDDRRILEFASGAAAYSLAAEDSVSGMKTADEIDAFISKTMRNTI